MDVSRPLLEGLIANQGRYSPRCWSQYSTVEHMTVTKKLTQLQTQLGCTSLTKIQQRHKAYSKQLGEQSQVTDLENTQPNLCCYKRTTVTVSLSIRQSNLVFKYNYLSDNSQMNSSHIHSIEAFMKEASKSYRSREYSEALSLYETALETLGKVDHPSNYRYFNYLTSLKGLAHGHLNSDDKAMDAYNLVLEKDSLNVTTLVRRAVLFMKQGQYQESWDDLQRGLMVDPDNHRIEFYIQQLNEKLVNMKESSKIKYPLKRKISQVVKFPEIEQDMILNFSNLKLIDKQSHHSGKSVCIVKQPTATIETEGYFDMDDLITRLINHIILTPEEIGEIEAENEKELEPKHLEQEITNERRRSSPIKILYQSGISGQNESILKCSTILSPSNLNSGVEGVEDKSKRVSGLQVKNIDGKIIRPDESSNHGSKGSEDRSPNEDQDGSASDPDILFGAIMSIQTLGKKEIPVYKTHSLKRKSSLRKGHSIVNRTKQKSLFERPSIGITGDSIDGHMIRRQSQQPKESRMSGSSEGSFHHVRIADETSDLGSDIRYSNCSKSDYDDLPSPLKLGLGATLKRKESILRNPKRKYEEIKEVNENVQHEHDH